MASVQRSIMLRLYGADECSPKPDGGRRRRKRDQKRLQLLNYGNPVTAGHEPAAASRRNSDARFGLSNGRLIFGLCPRGIPARIISSPNFLPLKDSRGAYEEAYGELVTRARVGEIFSYSGQFWVLQGRSDSARGTSAEPGRRLEFDRGAGKGIRSNCRKKKERRWDHAGVGRPRRPAGKNIHPLFRRNWPCQTNGTIRFTPIHLSDRVVGLCRRKQGQAGSVNFGALSPLFKNRTLFSHGNSREKKPPRQRDAGICLAKHQKRLCGRPENMEGPRQA